MKMNNEIFDANAYPLSEGDGRHYHFVKAAVEFEGEWFAADILGGGYSLFGLLPAHDQDEAEKWAKVHNEYVGFTDEYIQKCLDWSRETICCEDCGKEFFAALQPKGAEYSICTECWEELNNV